MITLGIATSFLVGLSILYALPFRFSILEKVGLSFLIGIAAQTLLMLFMDGVNVSLCAVNILIVSYLLILILGVKCFIRRKKRQDRSTCPPFRFPSDLNLLWLFFMLLIVYLECMNWTKCMFYPTFDKDSLSGFDTIGWILSQEQTLKGLSIFQGDYMPSIHGPGSYITYMPMIQLSYAYVYALGAETSKIIPALIYLSFLVSFYAVAKHSCGRTAASIVTFFVLATPEMTAFSSLSGTNVIHACYASLGVIYTVLWLKEEDKKYFVSAILLMACNAWVRNEGVVFAGASICMVALYKLSKGAWKELCIYAIFTLSPLFIWSIFMKINGIYAESILILRPFIDTGKAHTILQSFGSLLSDTRYYGISFVAFAAALLLNLKQIVKSRRLPALVSVVFLSLLFYALLLYQIDYKWDKIENVLAYSAKRFLFCYIPLVWWYVVANPVSVRLFRRLDQRLGVSKEPGSEG